MFLFFVWQYLQKNIILSILTAHFLSFYDDFYTKKSTQYQHQYIVPKTTHLIKVKQNDVVKPAKICSYKIIVILFINK